MLSPSATKFMGYTFKNFDLVNDHQIPELGAFKYSSLSQLIFSFIILQNFHVHLSEFNEQLH
jgi:hypothetical protein